MDITEARSQKPPETVLEVEKVKIFPGGAFPQLMSAFIIYIQRKIFFRQSLIFSYIVHVIT